MKRVAFFMPTLGGGGAERVTMALAKGLAERGHSVWLLVAAATGSLVHEVPPNVTLVDLRKRRVMAAIPALARWLRVNQPDVLIATQGHANIAAYIACRLVGVDSRLLVREVSTPSANLRHLTGLRGWAWRALLRHVYRRADTVIAVSRGVADDLQVYLHCRLDNLRVIYNPVISPEIYQKASEPLDHPWFQSDAEMPVVLAVGRLTEAKNYPLLLRAFAMVVRQRPAKLLILGEGEERPELEMLVRELGISEFVALPGFDANPFRYMARCRLYVMSSDWEGLPGSLIQALALHGNVIATDCPSGPKEVLKGGQLGMLVPVGDVHSLAVAMLARLDGGARHLETNLGTQDWLKKFSAPDVISEYEAMAQDGWVHDR